MYAGSDTQLNGSRVGLSLPGYWGILPTGFDIVPKPVGSSISMVHNEYKTHCKHGHEFNETNTLVRSNGHRNCKMCNTLRMRKVRAA